jgi:flagellar biosynthetic protein FlhB
MADSAQDKTQPATPKRISQARKDGQVPRSRDLGHFVTLAVGTTVLSSVGPALTGWMQDLMADGLRFDRAMVITPALASEHAIGLIGRGLMVVLPMALLMIAVAILTVLLSGGWNVSFKAMSPSFARINPLAGLGRMFTKQHTLDVGKVTLLAICVATAGAMYLRAHLDDLAGVLTAALPVAVAEVAQTVRGGLTVMIAVLGVWALIDVPLQRYLYFDRLKMSKEEVKKEAKDSEGSNLVKGKIKQRMQEVARKRMLKAVPLADLVVMNPTHYAVALKYDEAQMGAPRVVAKGADLLAMKIRDIAREAKVPVLQAPPLARALYAHVEVDQEVPAALFAAVAQVLAWVYQLRRSPAQAPSEPPQVQVPPELDPLGSAQRRGGSA